MRLRLVILAASLGALTLAAAPAPAHAQAAADLPVEAIERIVRDYLLREPEVIYEAIQELQRRREQAEIERARGQIFANADRLFDDARDPVAGAADGAVVLVEFFDYRCGYCRAMVGGINELIEATPDLRFVFKEFPILGPDSLAAARAALAAERQGSYLAMHNALMAASDLSQDGIETIARELGLDLERLRADMADPAIQQLIDDNRRLAAELGINGTPSFVIGEELVPGAVPMARLAELIATERARH
jgi:protein-disulfide isomerase